MALPLWIAGQVRNDGAEYAERVCATVATFHHCVAGSNLVVSYSAWRVPATLWIADQVRNDGPGCWLVLSCSPSAPVSGTGTGFDSSHIKDTFAKLGCLIDNACIYLYLHLCINMEL